MFRRRSRMKLNVIWNERKRRWIQIRRRKFIETRDQRSFSSWTMKLALDSLSSLDQRFFKSLVYSHRRKTFSSPVISAISKKKCKSSFKIFHTENNWKFFVEICSQHIYALRTRPMNKEFLLVAIVPMESMARKGKQFLLIMREIRDDMHVRF